MSDPWERPADSAIPLRSIDKQIEPIFMALGRAVSSWEGVQASVTELFFSLLQHGQEGEDEQALEQFGKILRVPDRAREVRRQTDVLFADAGGFDQSFEDEFRSELNTLLRLYEGWTQRRNDLAHGYVTEWLAPDYDHDEQPVVTFYGLLPSHARTRKWFDYEPEYNYVAQDIERFADAFLSLDSDFVELAQKMNIARGVDLEV